MHMPAFDDGSFDICLDKNLMDNVACSDGSWEKISAYLKEVCRCLRLGGTFFCVSYGKPDTRMDYLSQEMLDFGGAEEVRIEEVRCPLGTRRSSHGLYICRKLAKKPPPGSFSKASAPAGVAPADPFQSLRASAKARRLW